MEQKTEYELVEVGKLTPYARNSKTHTDEQVAQIAASIKEFGFLTPLVITEDGTILCGHGRFLAAQRLGLEKIPCVRESHLTEAQKRAYIIADNKIGENAEWDKDMLAVELTDLMGNDFDMNLLGFSEEELNSYLNAWDEGEAKEDDFDVDAAAEAEPFVKEGDLIKLGRHRLLCGDSTKPEDIARLMDGKKANLCITDPPYGIAIGTGAAYQNTTKDRTIMNDNLPDEEFLEFLVKAFKNIRDSLVAGGVFYIWYASNKSRIFLEALKDAGLDMRQNLIWEKNTFTLGRQDYQWSHEPCIYSWVEGGSHKWYSDRKQSTVLHYDKPKSSKFHSTMKPLPLIGYQMKNSSQENGIVLDLFGGSGTTLIAAEQMNRICHMTELDPKFASAIVRRYAALKGGVDDVTIIRDGAEIPCSEIYVPTEDDLAYKDQSADAPQKGRRRYE